MEASTSINDMTLLIEREHALELEAVDRARLAIEKRIDARGFAEGSVTARVSLRNSIELTAARIDEWLDEQSRTRRKNIAYMNIQLLSTEQLAFITGRVLLDQAFKDKTSYTKLCGQVASQVREVASYAMFEKANKGLAVKIEKQLVKSSSMKHARAVTSKAMSTAEFEGLKWESSQQIALGSILINCFCEATDLFRKDVLHSRGKSTAYLMPTVTLQLLLAQADIRDSLILPFHYPMIVPPLDWTTVDNGGYLNQELHNIRLVKGDASIATRLAATDTTAVRSAVNAIQSTPWRINRKVLEVLQVLNDAGNGSAGLASSVQPELPENDFPKLKKAEWKEWREVPENKVAFDEWNALAKKAHVARRKWASGRLVQQQQIMVGEKFVDEAAIYFPHTVDFRSRVYPVAGCGSVNPQANDTGKSLLEFADGKALGEDGARWLAIHTANVWGNDKVSFDDRELWTEMNTGFILECAADPINNTRWMAADKPFGFLAACFEWAGYHQDGDDHISHLPIAMDGSCSGLQHFGAMLKDEGTCRAVNVIQTGDTPQDVYSVVLKKVQQLVDASDDPMATQWSTRLHRNIVKQPVMTSVYSVTRRGIQGQINTWIKKLVDKKDIEAFEDVTEFQAAMWLAPIVVEAIGDELSAATLAMDWLKHACGVVSSTGSLMEWQTPVGFTVFQSYRSLNSLTIEIKWAGKRQQINLKTQSKKLDPRKCVNGIAANFVHSQDAAHLMLVANTAKQHGVDSFAFIHDSFGTHACNTTLLNEVLREAFITQYEGDTLGDLYAQIQDQVSPEVFEKIDPPPAQGTLCLSAVADSEYFFA